jgi:hypothetical protein
MEKNIYNEAKEAFLKGSKPESVEDIQPYYAKEYRKKLDEQIIEGLKKFDGNFYIQMMFFRDKSIKFGNVYKVLGRACRGVPTPTYLNDMYKFNKATHKLELLWSIPSVMDCNLMLHNRKYIKPQEYPLLKEVLNFWDGTYLKRCNEENESVVRSLKK